MKTVRAGPDLMPAQPGSLQNPPRLSWGAREGREGVNKGGAEGEREITLSRTHSLTLGPEQSDLQLRVCVCVNQSQV